MPGDTSGMKIYTKAAPLPYKNFTIAGASNPRVRSGNLPDRPALRDHRQVSSVLVAAVMFNAVLALINANVMQLSSIEVIACEAIIDAAALALSLRSGPDPMKGRWLGLMIFLLILNLANAVSSGGFDPKFLRDVLIIPVFVLLGLRSDREQTIRLIIWLQWIVLAVMLFEAISPETYGRIFNVMSYYINTRGYELDQFWSKDTSDLFVSATRPGERYLMAFLNIHRLSSVFLEPVSLGNYCVIVAMALVALWDEIGWSWRIFLVVSTAMLIVGCDGRFASTSIIIMIALRFLAPTLPRYANAAYLPGILFLAAIVVTLGHLSTEGDDFPTRTAGSVTALSEMGFVDWLGGHTSYAYQVMDSGIAYLLYSQSIIGATVIWIAISCGLPQRNRPTIIYAHATSIYVALNLLVSYSMFSIKTAALLWFVFGSLSRRTSEVAAAANSELTLAPIRRRLPNAMGQAK